MNGRVEAAKRLGARVDACVHCAKEFLLGDDTFAVERPSPGGAGSGGRGFGYACSFDCAKAKVDSMGEGYVWRPNRGGCAPLYEKGTP